MNPEVLETLIYVGVLIFFGVLITAFVTDPIDDKFYNEHDDLFH